MTRLYKKVQNYENTDDKYEKEAKKLKKEYTSFWEGVGDVINEVADIVVKFGEGLFDGIKDFLVGLVKLVGGTLKYAGSATLCLYGEVSGEDVPNWAKECYNDTNEMVLGVLKDPTILVEGLAQGVSDSFEEKGGAYCGGYAVGTVASAIVGTKGMDKLRGLAKGAGVAGKAEKVAAATEGVAETTETTQKIAGTIERVEALKGAEGVSEVLSGADDVARSVESTSTVEEVGETIIKDGSQLENGHLKPNVKYQTGEFEYIYETDAHGRITKWSTDNLQMTTRTERLPHNPKTPGKLSGDHAGHLAGDRFGGSPEIDNLVSQAENVNLSQYKKIENQWAKVISEGKEVKVNVDIIYEGDNLRPMEFNVEYTIDGKFYLKNIMN